MIADPSNEYERIIEKKSCHSFMATLFEYWLKCFCHKNESHSLSLIVWFYIMSHHCFVVYHYSNWIDKFHSFHFGGRIVRHHIWIVWICMWNHNKSKWSCEPRTFSTMLWHGKGRPKGRHLLTKRVIFSRFTANTDEINSEKCVPVNLVMSVIFLTLHIQSIPKRTAISRVRFTSIGC